MSAARRATVLMYHAVGAGTQAAAADPHYTVAEAAFRDHISLVSERGLRPACVRDLLATRPEGPAVAFTFDDGDETNLEAATLLAQAGGRGDFFVNSSRVGTPGFLGWPELREMSRAGHSIQSHGHEHRYLDDMDAAEIREQLARSKSAIEDALGLPVTLFAPPGGRITPAAVRIARDVGYEAICSSQTGLWRMDAASPEIPRLAVLATTHPAQFGRWIAQDAWELGRMQLRHGVLAASKKVLGNHRYEQVRSRLLGKGTTEAPPH
jgi:peptidoglycan/xylan/chitin deacetylase (PgdA/CDA1 family)